MFVFVRAHEPVEQLRLLLVRPVPRATGATVLADLGIVRIVVVDIGSSLLRGALGIMGFELFALGRGGGRLTIDGLHGHLVGWSVKGHVVCMMRRPRMVGGDDVWTGVVTVVVRARVEGDLGEMRIQRLVQGLLGSDINEIGDDEGSLTWPLGST
jgi:hypothetical protein